MDYYDEQRREHTLVRLNPGILALGISNVHITKKAHEDLEKHFHKVTHLHLQAKGIDILDNLQTFTQLTVLYLYDNRIRVIECLGNCKHLEQLYLQRNWIQKISGLNECKKLKKLYLGFNEIQTLEGLECLPKLNELHIEYQRLPRGERLKMNPLTLDSLSRCLEFLDISGNQLGTIEDFAGMLKLNTIIAKENQIENLDKITLILTTIPELKVLDLQGNSITKLPKYKERIIGYGEKLEILDGKEISRVSRHFMQRFCQAKSKRLQRIVDSIGADGTGASSSLSSVTPDISDTTSSKELSNSKSLFSSPKENRQSKISSDLEFIKEPPKFQHFPSKPEAQYPHSKLSPSASVSLLSPSDSVPEFTLRPREGRINMNLNGQSDEMIRTIVPPKKTFPKSTLSKSIIDFKNLENPELYEPKRERKLSEMQTKKVQLIKDLPSRIFQKIVDKFEENGLPVPQNYESRTKAEEIYSYPHYLSGPNQSYPSMLLPSKGKKSRINANSKSLSWTVMTPSPTSSENLNMNYIKQQQQLPTQIEKVPWEGSGYAHGYGYGHGQTPPSSFENEIITTRSLHLKSPPGLSESFYKLNLNLNENPSSESLGKQPEDSKSQEETSSVKVEESKEKVDSPPKPFESHVYQLPPWPHILRNVGSGSDQPKITFIS